MNPIRDVEKKLRDLFQTATYEVSAPAMEGGDWFLDVLHEGNALVIQWNRGGPFGLSSLQGHGYGEKPAEVYQTGDEVVSRVTELLQGKERTQRPKEVTLRELRAERNLSQVKLAKLLGVEQPAVSRLENRLSHMRLDTLRAIVKALQGKLILQVLFEDGAVRHLRIEDDDRDTPEEPEAIVVAPGMPGNKTC